MKIISIIVGLFFVIASVILIRLTRDGVSLHSAPMIAPSRQDADFKNLAQATVQRLFPDLQSTTHLLIGYPRSMAEASEILTLMKEE